MIYVFTYVLSVFSSILHSKRFTYIAFWLVVLIAVFKIETGNDWENYKRFFLNIDQYGFLKLEPGYTLLNYIFKDIGFDYYHVISFVSFLIGLAAFSHIKSSPAPAIALLIFLRYTYFQTEYMFIRQGLAVVLFFTALEFYRNHKKNIAFVLVLLGLSFHVSIIVYLPSFLFAHLSPKSYKYLVILFVVSLLSFVDYTYFSSYIPIDFIKIKVVGYTDNLVWNRKSSLSLSFLERLMFVSLTMYALHNLKSDTSKLRFYFNIYFFGTLLYLLFYKNYIFAERFSIISNYALVFTVPELFVKSDNSLSKLLKFSLIIIVMLFLLKNLTNQESTLLPYKTYLL